MTTSTGQERIIRLVKPGKLQVGDLIRPDSNYFRAHPQSVRVIAVVPVRQDGRIHHYSVRFERPAGVDPNMVPDHFRAYPSRNLRVYDA